MFRRQRKRLPPASRRVATPGSTAPVFSYRSSRSRSEAPTGRYEAAKPARNQWYKSLVNLPTYVAVVVIVGSVVYAATLSSTPHIQIFNDGQPVVVLRDKTVYTQAAHRLLDSSILNYTKPTIDSEHIASEMQKQFPELGSAAVSIPLIDRHPIIQITYETPKLILQTGHDSLVIGENGRALVKTSDVPPGTKLGLPVLIDQTGLQVKPGDRALTDVGVQFIETVIAQLQAKSLRVASMTLPTTPEELDVRLEGKPYIIKFNLLNDARQQVGTYLALQQKLDADGVTPSQYIDLRVDERAYYQ